MAQVQSQQVLHSPMKWSARPLPSKPWKRFALTSGVGLAFVTGTAAALGVARVVTSSATSTNKWNDKSKSIYYTRQEVAKKLGLPAPLTDSELKNMDSQTLENNREFAQTTMIGAFTMGLAFAGGGLALLKFNPRTRRELFTFRGPAIIMGTCAATTLATIPLSLYPVYNQLAQHQCTMIEYPRYWNWKE